MNFLFALGVIAFLGLILFLIWLVGQDEPLPAPRIDRITQPGDDYKVGESKVRFP
jgi:hypothetical protein